MTEAKYTVGQTVRWGPFTGKIKGFNTWPDGKTTYTVIFTCGSIPEGELHLPEEAPDE